MSALNIRRYNLAVELGMGVDRSFSNTTACCTDAARSGYNHRIVLPSPHASLKTMDICHAGCVRQFYEAWNKRYGDGKDRKMDTAEKISHIDYYGGAVLPPKPALKPGAALYDLLYGSDDQKNRIASYKCASCGCSINDLVFYSCLICCDSKKICQKCFDEHAPVHAVKKTATTSAAATDADISGDK